VNASLSRKAIAGNLFWTPCHWLGVSWGLYGGIGGPSGSEPDKAVEDGVAKGVGEFIGPFPPFSLDSSSMSFIRKALKSSDVGGGVASE
jgi:hypothetical protein